MRTVVWLIAMFWGIGQNLPFEQLYVHGINPGDFIFLGLLSVQLTHPESRVEFITEAERLWSLFLLIAVFVTLTAISSAVNVHTWGLYGNDIVEMLRPLYYFLLVVFVSVNTRRYGISLVVAFLSGILVSGIVAYLMPSNPDMLGFVVLWNPNVVGNMLAFGALLASLLIFEGRIAAASLFLFAFLLLSVFTYSKGTWLMVILGLIAFVIALHEHSGGQVRRVGKRILVAGILGLILLGAAYFDELYELVRFKIATTQIDDSAVEGSTTAARWGFVKASLLLVLENPVFGVGISNYESAYDSLEHVLGNDYWPTDNPHSAWLYILACIGIPALFVFLGIVVRVLAEFNTRIPLNGRSRLFYIGLFTMVLFLSGSVVLHVLTQYFFWFFAGIVSGWQPSGRDARLFAAQA